MGCVANRPTSPAVVNIETDISDFAGAVSSNIMAIVGASQKGRTDIPVPISSQSQFLKQFGAPVSRSLAAANFPTYAAYNAMNYLEQGNRLLFQRLDASGVPKAIGYSPVPVSVDYDLATDTFTINYSSTDLFKFTARGEGVWGGHVFAQVVIPKGQFDRRQSFTGNVNFTFNLLIWEFEIDDDGNCVSTLREQFNGLKQTGCDQILEASEFLTLDILSSDVVPVTTPTWFNAAVLSGMVGGQMNEEETQFVLTTPMGWEYCDADLSPLNDTDFYPSFTADTAGPYTVTAGVNDVLAFDVHRASGLIIPANPLGPVGVVTITPPAIPLSVSDIVTLINAGSAVHGIAADTDSMGRLLITADEAVHGVGATLRINFTYHTATNVFNLFGFRGCFITNVTPDLQDCFEVDSDGEPAHIDATFRQQYTQDVDGVAGAGPVNIVQVLVNEPVYPGTIVITWSDGVVIRSAVDDGNGNIVGDVDAGGSNTINYETGALDFDTVGAISNDGIAPGVDLRIVYYGGQVLITLGTDDRLRFRMVDGDLFADTEFVITAGTDTAAVVVASINAAFVLEQFYKSFVDSIDVQPGPINTSGDNSIAFELYDTTDAITQQIVTVTLTVGAVVTPAQIIADINNAPGGLLTATYEFTTDKIRVVPSSASGYNKVRISDGTVTSGVLFPDNDLVDSAFEAYFTSGDGEVNPAPTFPAPLTIVVASLVAGDDKTVTALTPSTDSGLTKVGFAAGQSDTGKDAFITLQNQDLSISTDYNGSYALGGVLGCNFFIALNASDVQIGSNAFDDLPISVCTTPYDVISDNEIVAAVCALVGESSLLADVEAYTFNILMVPANMGLRQSLAEAIIACACALGECRQDILVILDMDQGLDKNAAVQFRRSRMSSSSYCATFWPWLKIFDVDAECGLLVPPSFGMAQVIPYNDRVGEPWFAPAGLNRGRAFKVLGVEFRSNQGDRDFLYDDQINSFVEFPGEGVVNWGQKTLLRKNSALNRINVRRLLNNIKQIALRVGRFFLFEPLDETTARRYKQTIEPFLEDIANRRGLRRVNGDPGYKVDVGPNVNTPEVFERSEMIARIYLRPTKSLEILTNDLTVVRQDADLS